MIFHSSSGMTPAQLSPYADFLVRAKIESVHVAFDAERAAAAIAAPGAPGDQPGVCVLMRDERGALWVLSLRPVVIERSGVELPGIRLRLLRDEDL